MSASLFSEEITELRAKAAAELFNELPKAIKAAKTVDEKEKLSKILVTFICASFELEHHGVVADATSRTIKNVASRRDPLDEL